MINLTLTQLEEINYLKGFMHNRIIHFCEQIRVGENAFIRMTDNGHAGDKDPFQIPFQTIQDYVSIFGAKVDIEQNDKQQKVYYFHN